MQFFTFNKLIYSLLFIFLPCNLIASHVPQEQKGDLYYFLQPITDENREVWKKFSGEMRDVKGLFGALQGFNPGINEERKHNYIAYATTKATPLKSVEEIKKYALIVMTTTNLGKANGHYGIFRNPLADGNKGRGQLSLKLHGFAAKEMQKLYPQSSYIIVPPLESMANILQQSGLKIGKDIQIFSDPGWEAPWRSCKNSKEDWLCQNKETKEFFIELFMMHKIYTL